MSQNPKKRHAVRQTRHAGAKSITRRPESVIAAVPGRVPVQPQFFARKTRLCHGYGRRRRGEHSASIATPNPSPPVSPKITNGHGEIPVNSQYALAMTTPRRLVATNAASVSSINGSNRITCPSLRLYHSARPVVTIEPNARAQQELE